MLAVLRPVASCIHHHSRSLHKPRSLRNIRLKMESRPLSYGHGPMVWIDCEMTGLDADKDKILEIAVSAARFFAAIMRVLVLTVSMIFFW